MDSLSMGKLGADIVLVLLVLLGGVLLVGIDYRLARHTFFQSMSRMVLELGHLMP